MSFFDRYRKYYTVTDLGTLADMKAKEKEIKALGGDIECTIDLEKRKYIDENYPTMVFEYATEEEAIAGEARLRAVNHRTYRNMVIDCREEI